MKVVPVLNGITAILWMLIATINASLGNMGLAMLNVVLAVVYTGLAAITYTSNNNDSN